MCIRDRPIEVLAKRGADAIRFGPMKPVGPVSYTHLAEYGFILRYPKGKENITAVIYEPWHYRYVGVEAAKEIMSRDITLEEYIQEKGM